MLEFVQALVALFSVLMAMGLFFGFIMWLVGVITDLQDKKTLKLLKKYGIL